MVIKNKINYQNYIPNRKHNIKYIGYMRFVMISLKVWNLQIHHYSIVGFSISNSHLDTVLFYGSIFVFAAIFIFVCSVNSFNLCHER